jgi:hypothetical protein
LSEWGRIGVSGRYTIAAQSAVTAFGHHSRFLDGGLSAVGLLVGGEVVGVSYDTEHLTPGLRRAVNRSAALDGNLRYAGVNASE